MKELRDLFAEIEGKDRKLKEYAEKNAALASFLNDIDILKQRGHLTQKDVAKKMGTTQSSVSRIESLKTNPSYSVLVSMSKAVGGNLLLTPMADMTVTVPLDLQEKVACLAAKEDKSPHDFLLDIVRSEVDVRYTEVESLFSNIIASAIFCDGNEAIEEKYGASKTVENTNILPGDDLAA